MRRPVTQYLRVPKCRNCGGSRWWFDRTYAKRRARSNCRCDGVPFTHRKGTIVQVYKAVCRYADPKAASLVAGSWPDPNGGTWVEGEHVPF